MNKEWLSLVRALEGELDLYRALTQQLAKRTDILVASDMIALAQNNEEAETLLQKIRAIEATLPSLLQATARSLNGPSDVATLSALVEINTEPDAKRLRDLAATLQNLVVQVERLNRRNAILFEHTLEYLQTLGDLMIGTVSSYQSSGALQPPRLMASSLSHEA